MMTNVITQNDLGREHLIRFNPYKTLFLVNSSGKMAAAIGQRPIVSRKQD